MLEALRRGAAGWVAKILFGVLVLSFAIWGIPHDFLGGGGNYLARVGSTTISPNEFQRMFNQSLAAGQEPGQRLTSEQARAAGLDSLVLQRLVEQAALQTNTHELGLSLPNEAIVEEIRTAKAFEGTDGQFSRPRYEAYLEQTDVSEQRFFQMLRDDGLNSQLISALTSAVAAPAALVDMQNAYREETRVIEHFTIDPAKVPAPGEPDDAKLKEVFEQNKTGFATPEIRQIGAVVVSIEQLKKSIEIPDGDVKTAYEASIHTYEEPERRAVEQITFKDKATAEAAKAEITGGKSFADVATAAGLKDSDTKLGTKTKVELIDPKVADAAFALQKDEVSAVVESAFAPVLLRVTEITPGKRSSLEEVKDKVRAKLAADKAQTLIQETADHVEEGLNAGKTLKDIAGELKLTYVEAETDQDNKTADGKTAIDLPEAATLIQAGFATQPGVETARVDLPGNSGFAWPIVLNVTASQPKPFDAVKDAVKALYIQRETQGALGKLAGSLVARLSKGEELDKVAADAGGKPETTLPITRMTSPQGLPQSGVTQAFTLPAGQAGSTSTSDAKSGVIFRVKEIKPAPAPSKEQADKLAGELTKSLQQDLLTTYISAVQNKLDLSINTREFRRITGAEAEQP